MIFSSANILCASNSRYQAAKNTRPRSQQCRGKVKVERPGMEEPENPGASLTYPVVAQK